MRRTDLQKHLFLFTQGVEAPPYDFVPYQYGCYSFSAEADRAPMVRAGLLHDTDGWEKKTATRYGDKLQPDDLERLRAHVQVYGTLRGEDLVRAVYTEYPYYATRSRIASDILSAEEMDAVEASRPERGDGALLSLGYEGKSVEAYFNLLLQNGVTVLCDVRRNPVSRKYGFSKSTLGGLAGKLGVRYIHVPELGIASEKRQCLDEPGAREALFTAYEQDVLPHQSEALGRLANLVEDGERVALTCFEAHVGDCHRSRVSKAIAEREGWNAPVEHL